MKYAALLRGIMPMNAKTRNDKLCAVFEACGFANVKSVIASGNIIFESSSRSRAALEAKIEKALLAKLDFDKPVMIRSEADLEKMVASDPFKGAPHSRERYLIVTFMKKAPFEVFNSLDLAAPNTPEFMKGLEKKYGKDITTRTWKTILRILEKMR